MPRGGWAVLHYLIRRFIYMILTVVFVSIVAFVVIQLPPGDYLSSYVMQLEADGHSVTDAQLASLTRQYGLDRPLIAQYVLWIGNIVLRGDFGQSFEWNRPVEQLIWDRFALTATMAIATMLFTFVVAIPIGIYSALHQYSVGDFAVTVVGYVGLATPNFLLALVLMFLGQRWLGMSVGGLFSPRYLDAPWSLAKVLDMLSHLWIPVIVLGTAGTAWLVRTTRSMLLDELRKQYVITARTKGLSEGRLIFKYPVRIALIPVASTIGWQLTSIISGAPVVAVVLSLPTTGPLLLSSLLSQDMFLAGSFILVMSILTVIGTFVSDLLLAAVDPRIRYDR